ncbi:hypothetical protein BI364_04510 [Acidihalobacter yilgarnensis]|uniref:Histidine kinase N-terminal 7TM region domain-containing protein n=1 Tax=Acidihalobacter yilgarnensis TaxID=2819280 RepID=A0A1D8ILM7_9GAMM|nr:hypothetical protein [Acidihalobacter yilgarnensis]AOU97350.1 hypothetical protein BI364_04510 [Acidihalobacter yilgarnensis]
MHTSNWIMATSYGIGTIAFLGLLTFQIFNWGRQSLGIALIAACALNILWLATAALWSIYPTFLPWPAVIISEAIRDGGWLYLLSTLLQRTDDRHNWIAILPYIAALAPIAWISYVFVPSLSIPSGLSDITTTLPNNLISGGLVISIIELALLEQVCRNIAPERRWALKYLCIGIGIQVGYDIFLYSEALLYHRISAAFWDARGAVVAMAAPMLMIATTRNPQWTRNFLISRQAAFRTATLLSVGTYLITISAGGYYIRYWGAHGENFGLFFSFRRHLLHFLYCFRLEK